MSKKENYGYLLEVDVRYLKEIHYSHSDLPFMCEKMKMNGVEKLTPSLLVNIFEEFRSTCMKHYGLDPANFYTSPGLAWKACLKKTGIKLDLLTDPDMLMMFERGIRGGITQAVHRYAKANNKYIDSVNPENQIFLHSIPRCEQPLWMGDVTTAPDWRI